MVLAVNVISSCSSTCIIRCICSFLKGSICLPEKCLLNGFLRLLSVILYLMVKQSTRSDFYLAAGAFSILLFYILSLFCDALFLFFFVYAMLLNRVDSMVGIPESENSATMPLLIRHDAALYHCRGRRHLFKPYGYYSLFGPDTPIYSLIAPQKALPVFPKFKLN